MYNCACYYSPYDKANVFDCRNKNLTSLPKNILLQTNSILASGNNFGSIERVEKYMENITHLDLSNSRVSHITDGAMRSILMKLKTFNLSNNVLKNLPSSVRETNNNTKLWISNNSYDCNCDMMWMRDWLVKTTSVVDKEQVVRASGKMIGNMHEFLNVFDIKSRNCEVNPMHHHHQFCRYPYLSAG